MSSSIMSATGSGGSSALDDKLPMCLSPLDKLKGSSKVAAIAQQRKKVQASASATLTAAAATVPLSSVSTVSSCGLTVKTNLSVMEIDVTEAALGLDVDLDLDLVEGDDDDEDMEAGWISDDNLRALEFDDRLNQDIDWVTHDDVESSIKLEFVPNVDDVQDFAFDPSSFLSPLRGGLALDEDSSMSSSFAESLSVELPRVKSQDAEKLLMSFDTMNFTIPSPTSSSTKKNRGSLFGKKEIDTKNVGAIKVSARPSLSANGTMSPSLKQKAGQAEDAARKDDPRASLSALTIPSSEPFLGVLSITTPTSSGGPSGEKKIGSYSPNARKLRIQKFHQKRKNRTWKKSIKYDCRKKLADDRPRIKGRFVRVLENDSKDDATSTTSSQPSSTPVSSPTSTPPATPSPAAATAASIAVARSMHVSSLAAVAAINAANAVMVSPPTTVPTPTMTTVSPQLQPPTPQPVATMMQMVAPMLTAGKS